MGSIVDVGEGAGEGHGHKTEQRAGGHGNGNQLPAGILDLRFRGGGTQHLAHENAVRRAHGHKHHAGQVEQGGGDVQGGHHVQAAGGVALVHKGHAGGPEQLVGKQGHSLDDDVFQQPAGNHKGPVGPHDEGILLRVQMGPARHDAQLHKPGDDGGQGRALHTHLRSAEVAEDQDVVQHQVHQGGHDAAQHGDEGLPGFLQGAGIGAGDGEGQKAQEHPFKIPLAVFQNGAGVGGGTLAGEEEADQGLAGKGEYQKSGTGQHRADQQLEPEGMADALVVPGALELGGENSSPGGGAEDAQVENKHQLVDDGNAAHRQGAHLAHHDVIQQGYKIGDAVLDDDGHHNGHHPPVKGPVADVTLQSHFSFLFLKHSFRKGMIAWNSPKSKGVSPRFLQPNAGTGGHKKPPQENGADFGTGGSVSRVLF